MSAHVLTEPLSSHRFEISVVTAQGLDGDEFSSVGCVDMGDTGGVVDGCGVASGRFISVVFST